MHLPSQPERLLSSHTFFSTLAVSTNLSGRQKHCMQLFSKESCARKLLSRGGDAVLVPRGKGRQQWATGAYDT